MKIRIGDTFKRTFTFYNPIAGTNPPQPNLASPIDLSGKTYKFVIVTGSQEIVYDGTAVTVTPLLGKVKVQLSVLQTSALRPRSDVFTYLEETVTATGEVLSKIQQKTEIVKKHVP